jgi:tRNA-binding protein
LRVAALVYPVELIYRQSHLSFRSGTALAPLSYPEPGKTLAAAARIGNMETISWADFEKVELRAGTIVAAEAFPEARKPAYKLSVDFGPEIGVRKSSAQITVRYRAEELVGKQVLGVVNFPAKQIGPFVSECLTTGFADETGAIVLISPDVPVPNGAKLF